MKLLQATAEYLSRWDPRSPARKCPCCHRAIRPGEWVLHHEFRGAAFADATVHQHRACLLALCAGIDDDAPTAPDPVDPLAAAAALAEAFPATAGAC